MPLSAQEQFKVGFLLRSIEEGRTPAQMLQSIKQAEAGLDGLVKTALLGELASKVLDVGSGAANAALGWGVPAAIAAPPIVGGMAGYGLARAMDVDDTDVDEIKNRELQDEYRRQTLGLVRNRDVRDYQRLRQKNPGRVFFPR